MGNVRDSIYSVMFDKYIVAAHASAKAAMEVDNYVTDHVYFKLYGELISSKIDETQTLP